MLGHIARYKRAVQFMKNGIDPRSVMYPAVAGQRISGRLPTAELIELVLFPGATRDDQEGDTVSGERLQTADDTGNLPHRVGHDVVN